MNTCNPPENGTSANTQANLRDLNTLKSNFVLNYTELTVSKQKYRHKRVLRCSID